MLRRSCRSRAVKGVTTYASLRTHQRRDRGMIFMRMRKNCSARDRVKNADVGRGALVQRSRGVNGVAHAGRASTNANPADGGTRPSRLTSAL